MTPTSGRLLGPAKCLLVLAQLPSQPRYWVLLILSHSSHDCFVQFRGSPERLEGSKGCCYFAHPVMWSLSPRDSATLFAVMAAVVVATPAA